jgi:2',3'-cyclic-nucleotide 2'-phosphodiesterase (5'-nucleotidase family)
MTMTRALATILGLVLAVALAVGCAKREHELTIAYTNNMIGEIRSCGCGSHDYGGLGRRATFVDGLRKRSDNFLLFEGGDFFGLGVNYSEQKARLTTQAMSFIGYDGVVVGEKDFGQGVEYLVDRVNSLKLPVVVANLVDTESGELLFPASRTFELPSGLKVGVVGVVGPGLAFPEAVPPGRLRVEDPKSAIKREVEAIRDVVQLVVVLAHMPTASLRQLGKQIPDIDIIVAGHDARPTRKASTFGNAYLLTTVDRGRFMGIAWATLDTKDGIVNLITDVQPLGEDYTDHEAIVKLFQTYDMEIARVESQRISTGIQARSTFAGGAACKECHQEIYDQWMSTKHAHAFDILVRESREFDRDCTPCHTTGFYEIGGYMSIVDTPELKNVQCESCHGSSAAHVRTPIVKTPTNARSVCRSCHNAEQTPDFKFDTYWPKIAH